jgi:hypothetical protein
LQNTGIRSASSLAPGQPPKDRDFDRDDYTRVREAFAQFEEKRVFVVDFDVPNSVRIIARNLTLTPERHFGGRYLSRGNAVRLPSEARRVRPSGLPARETGNIVPFAAARGGQR